MPLPTSPVLIVITSLILLGSLSALAICDIREGRLPDVLTLPLMGVGLLVSLAVSDTLIPSVIGSITGYAIFLAVETLYRHVRQKDGLGRGDAKLLAAGGAWVGWTGLPIIVLIASITALVYVGTRSIRKGQTLSAASALPFGPFLAIAIATVWLYATALPALTATP